MSTQTDHIKSKIDIVSLLSSYIKLEKAGSNFKGRCPFHNEKTPSFFVSPDRGSYYCFGCQAKGDIFTFVQEFEGLDFVGALKVLADKAGIVLDFSKQGDRTERDRLFGVLEQAMFFYQMKMKENRLVGAGEISKKPLEYLLSRSVEQKTIEDFKIGFAPLEWRELFDFLISKKVSEGDMLKVGLVKQKTKTSEGGSPDPAKAGFREAYMDTYYDTFRGRIMFPISDSSGRVVGFSGRILIPDEKSPKYLNSPETELFNKSEILFGLDKAKKHIRLQDYSVLVEGQMDLVMLHQIGVTNAVASSGTALTVEHLTKLRRLSNRIIMCFDGDNAGFNASNKSAHMALSLGMELKVVALPEGKDPADMAKENPEELKEFLRNAKHIIDFYTDILLSRNLPARELGQEINKNVLPYVALLTSTIERDYFIKSIARKTFIKEDALWDDLRKIGTTQNTQVASVKREPVGEKKFSIERKLIGLIFWQEISPDKVPDQHGLKEKFKKIVGDGVGDLIKGFEKEKDLLLFETESYYNGSLNVQNDIEELLVNLESEYLKEQFSKTMVLLQKAEQSHDPNLVQKYLEECQRISQKINTLKNEKK